MRPKTCPKSARRRLPAFPRERLELFKCPASTCVGDALWHGPSPERPRRSRIPIEGEKLLDLHLGARFFELLFDRRGLVLVDAFLDGLRRAIHQVLGFFQAQARDFADRLDDVDLVAADIGEHDGEFRLLFRWCGTATRGCSTAR